MSDFFSLSYLPFWEVLFLSFTVALTGAMSPGPLLTYTIMKSVKSSRGYLMGFWVILGHAVLESIIILLIMLGFSYLLNNTLVIRIIGVIGGCTLILFGILNLKDLIKKKVDTGFLDVANQDVKQEGTKHKLHPVLGGFLVSMSNPYWWVWWITVGSAFLVKYKITLKQYPELIAFFIGHEGGDLGWYLVVSFFSYFGLRKLNKRVYYIILYICSALLIIFGLYLGISPLLDLKL